MSEAPTRPASKYPPQFEDWPREKRLDLVELAYTRRGLLRVILSLAGLEPVRDLHSRRRLRKDELAAILLALEGLDDSTG